MEENVALDSSKQKKFVKSIKGIKKLIKKNEADTEGKNEAGASEKVKTGRVTKKRKERGLVYLSHIPHGFYENEMSQYFKQFGVVTNVRVIKSKRTGRSKGYAFVEFKEPAVAQIVSETMNNYLMGKRLIKAAYVPPEKQRRNAFRKNWNAVNNPGNNLRLKMKKAYNEDRDELGELKRARKLLSNVNRTKKKLLELGINYNFFTPVDVPEALAKQIKNENDDEKNKSAGNKQKTAVAAEEKVKVKSKQKVTKTEKEEKPTEVKVKNEKKKSKDTAADITQKQKKQNLKDKGVTLLEDFINVTQDSNESDSSFEFDSDEYDSVLKHDDDDLSGGDSSDEVSGGSDEETDGDSGESEEIVLPQPKNKKGKKEIKPSIKESPVQSKKKVKVETQKKPIVQAVHTNKRKAPQNKPLKETPAVTLKKPKYEKQSNQKATNKQFKKKK